MPKSDGRLIGRSKIGPGRAHNHKKVAQLLLVRNSKGIASLPAHREDEDHALVVVDDDLETRGQRYYPAILARNMQRLPEVGKSIPASLPNPSSRDSRETASVESAGR